jgi:polyisoprenyl-teichoic acid--peptidoglycan teichoic acid transferase
MVVAVVVLLLAVAGVAAALFTGLLDRAIELAAPDAPVSAEAEVLGDRQPSLVIVTHDEDDPSGQAGGVMVLAYDRETEQGSIVLVPTAILTDVPGYGAFQLREAFALGDAPLVDISLGNLLGVEFDGAASVSVDGWSTWLDRTGGYEVTVRSPLTDPDGDVTDFEAGPQVLDGDRLAEYLAYRGDAESELETLPRVQDVLLGLLEQSAEDPQLLDEMFADGAPMVETTETRLLRTLLGQLATAHADGRVTTVTLPVTPLGSGREDSYRLDAARAATLVDDRLAASRPTEGAGVGRGVQILNGNGAEAVGRQVAERLSGGGYRVVLTGNADSFDYETTLIVVYDDTPEQLALAEDVRERLGVGEIQRSATPQSVVDVTIVVGADFPE